MNRDESEDMAAAYQSLFHGHVIVGGGPPWPEQVTPTLVPQVIVWCPHPKKRDRIGAVYETRWGYLWITVHRRTATPVRTKPNGRWIVTPVKFSHGYTLLTYPDGSRRSFGHGHTQGTGCRHWKPSQWRPPFKADAMFALLDDVRTGRVRRPAAYVAPWT